MCAESLQLYPTLRCYGLQLARLLCPWNFSGKNIGVGCHALLHRILLTQGSNHVSYVSFIGRQVLYGALAPPGKPYGRITKSALERKEKRACSTKYQPYCKTIVAKTLGISLVFQCRGLGFDPWSGKQDPTCQQMRPKINKTMALMQQQMNTAEKQEGLTDRTTRLLCLWDFPGKTTGGGCHFLLQYLFL